jgi:TldD protein
MENYNMPEIFNMAKQHLLEPAELSDIDLNQTLNTIMQGSIDSADLYFQSLSHESWVLEDGIVKDGCFDVDGGVGVRAISGDKTGFAYSNEIRLDALQQASNSARCIAQSGQNKQVNAWKHPVANKYYSTNNPLNSLAVDRKISILQEIDAIARSYDPSVKKVIASISGTYEHVLVATSDGTLAADIRPLVRLNVSVIAERNGRQEQGTYGGGGRGDYLQFFSDDVIKTYAEKAVQQALINLEAIDAPAGNMPVVLSPGWSGVLLHEAVGHGLEGDFNRKQTSVYAGKIGQQVASKLCTVVDDGTLLERRGSLNIDDEGVATQRTVLIENGILTGYMQDKLNAKLMNTASTGNGRRESYAHLPMPRMTNTFMLAGDSTEEEIISSVDRGIYVASMGGGQVDITSGKFVFSTTEAWLIENGKKISPIKGATLVGNGFDVMQNITMVGNDLQLDTGVGICGKDGQTVPVGVGQPTVKINSMTIGGTA